MNDNAARSVSGKNFYAALALPEIRLFILNLGFFTLASKAIAVVIGFQVYQLTHSVAMLGVLGLVEALPLITMAPFGGYIADRFNRRTILLVARFVSCLCALAMAFLSRGTGASMTGLYALVFMAGFARAFAEPASSAFEAQVVPKHLTLNASSWFSSAWISCAIAGPAAIGFVFDWLGAAGSYLVLAVCYLLSWFFTLLIAPKPQPAVTKQPQVWESIKTGWGFLFGNQPLFAAMLLDLFAVFFGGAIALLPVYASDILHTGAKGLGLLNAAPSVGALITTLLATKYPPARSAGKKLLLAVSGFGVSIMVFALSKNFFLSLGALFLSGAFDGVSMIIRRSMLRILSPEHLRGRIASANSVFICASNELGAFESGMGAAMLGTVPCVFAGGAMTIVIVLLCARYAPLLRDLSFSPNAEPVRA